MTRNIAILALCAVAACDTVPTNQRVDATGPDASLDAEVDAADASLNGPDGLLDGAADTSPEAGPDVGVTDAGVDIDSFPALDVDPVDTAISPVACSAAVAGVVAFQTEDGETLAADFHPTRTPNGPAVVRVHMIPPGNDRTNYPADFRELLVSRGIAVLNIDRRGGGFSTGKAIDAYQGPKGKLDVKAALAFLATAPCPIDMARVGLIGASNGTTSVLDYTVYAATDPKSAAPAAMVFLTGGTYTENQSTVDANLALLSPLPLLFVYASDEATWSTQFEELGPNAWRFEKYTPGGHGTNMFAVQPTSAAMVADWLVGAL